VIELRSEGDVTILELAHGRANALDLELCRGLRDRLAELTAAPCRAVVLTGRQDIFSAGVDLKRVLDGGVPYLAEFVPALDAAFEALVRFPKPLVAAVNGHAVAGGCVLACAADQRLMAAGPARIGVPELRVGVAFPGAVVEIMRLVVAPGHLQELLYRGATLEPQLALQWGLVDALAEPARLLDEALATAEDLASVPTESFRLTKAQLRAPALERIAAARERYGQAVLEQWCAPGTLAAIGAYVERTLGKRQA
jgi:enoyl-CoA hydratase